MKEVTHPQMPEMASTSRLKVAVGGAIAKTKRTEFEGDCKCRMRSDCSILVADQRVDQPPRFSLPGQKEEPIPD